MKLSKNDEIALALGHVAMQAGRLEFFCTTMATQLLNSRDAGLVLYGLPFSNVADILKGLVDRIANEGADDERSEVIDLCKSVQPLLGKLKPLMQQRSDVLHATWARGAESLGGAAPHHALLYKRRGRMLMPEHTAAGIERLADEIGEVAAPLLQAIGLLAQLRPPPIVGGG